MAPVVQRVNRAKLFYEVTKPLYSGFSIIFIIKSDTLNRKGIAKLCLSTLILIVLLGLTLYIIPVFSIPTFTDIFVQNNNSQYQPGKNFGFQVNITDDECGFLCISNATFETNLTTGGALENITKTDIAKYTTFENDTHGMWWINFTQEQTKGAGVYVFKWFANNTTSGVWSASSQSLFTILPNASNPVRLVIDNGTDAYNDQNVIITYGTSITVNCSNVYPNSGSCSLYRNGAPVANTTNETITLGGGVHNYTVTTDGDGQNYSANATGESFNVTVNRAPTSINLSINGTQANWTSTYPNSTLNATAAINVTGLTVSIMWNGTVICSGTTNCSSIVQYGGGYHNFTANYSISDNYSASSASWNVTISQGATNVTIYLNNSQGNQTSIYPNSTINVTAVANVTGVNVTISRNGTLIQNTTATATDVRSWGAYLNNFTAQVLSNANYSASSVVFLWWNVSKGTPTGSISGINVTLPSTTSITPLESNVGDADVNYSFWRDTSLVSLANGTTSLSAETQSTAGTYTYKLNSTAGENWTSSSSISTSVITVSPVPSSTPGGSSISGITTTGMITYVTLAVGKANITANYLTTSGKLIANIARYQDVAIRGLNITVVNNVANIKIMISKLPSLPSNVPYDINGRVYNYISTDEQNFTDADIKSVNISFAVNKTWLTNNNVDASNITMYRWANNKWNDLSAVKVSDDGKEVFFIASSPGLSVFIIGTKGGAPAVTVTPTCTESWTCTAWSTCTNSQQTRTCTDSNNCGTTTNKPTVSQSCTVSKGETPVVAPVTTSILTTVIVIVVAIIACVFIFLQRAKISSYLVTITKKSNNHKKTSYLESLARKINKVEEEEKLNVRTD